MYIIETKNLSYKYLPAKDSVVLDVNLKVESGEVIGIVGNSGCGKSTLAYILSGIIPHYISYGELKGELFIDGKDVFNSLSKDSVDVGIVMQNPDSQLFGFSVEDTIAFGLENTRLRRGEMVEKVNKVIGELHIEHLRTRFTNTLSGGQKQVACIASVLALDPKVLILDEPVSALDPGGRQLVQNAVGRLKELGRTVIVIDHNLEWISQLLDRLIVMNRGSIVFDGPTDSFFRDKEILDKSGVTPPQVTEIYHSLCRAGMDVPVFKDYSETVKFLNERNLIKRGPENATVSPCNSKAADKMSVCANGLSHFYDRVPAISDINVRFCSGRVVAIVGQNGSGKSTFVKHLNGLLKPSAGTLNVAGVSPDKTSIARMAQKVGMVFQNPEQMLFEESVEKEALFGIQAVFGKIGDEDRERVINLLKRFGLIEAAASAPFNLASGQKQALAIVSALAVKPEILILDEPTLGLDRKRKEELIQLIHDLKTEDRTVVLISHDLSLVAKAADDVLVINKGRMRAFGPVREVFAMNELFNEIGIPLPQITRLGLEWGHAGILTIDELMEHMKVS